MVQCEMCGTETSSPTTIKVEGAELEVCDDCTGFGTEVQTQESSSTSTKYSTSGSSGSSTTAGGSGSSNGRSSQRRGDMFDEMEELAPDYHDRIREARESAGLSQEELAGQLNEKASLVQKLERGDILPSDDVQRKLEGHLDISLTDEGATEDTDWETNLAEDGLTLGDKVRRRDE